MHRVPETRASLLIRLRNLDDTEAWGEFMQIYEPLIRRYIGRRGMQDADAADIAQEVLISVMRSIGRWDPSPDRGRFRTWLYTVVSHATSALLSRRRRHPQGTGATSVIVMLAEHASAEADRNAFDVEYERRIFEWACERVRPGFREATWTAFWLTGVEGRGGEEASKVTGLSVGAVYIAKSRVMARIKAEIEQAESLSPP
jgi:RNA polymerase sigma factor (sigma-70 family)